VNLVWENPSGRAGTGAVCAAIFFSETPVGPSHGLWGHARGRAISVSAPKEPKDTSARFSSLPFPGSSVRVRSRTASGGAAFCRCRLMCGSKPVVTKTCQFDAPSTNGSACARLPGQVVVLRAERRRSSLLARRSAAARGTTFALALPSKSGLGKSLSRSGAQRRRPSHVLHVTSAAMHSPS